MRNADDIYDELLVLRCQSGDADALAKLVSRWHPRLLAFAVHALGERHSAEDVVQSSWVDVVRRINTINDPKAIRPWLFRIVANKCKDKIRKRFTQRQHERSDQADQIPDPSLDEQEGESRQADQIARLRRKMKALDDGQREVLRLHYLEELPVDAIAHRLSIPPGTVKSRLYHARQKLKQSLSGDEP
ncbi:MAG: RNA polymerase sigma factor [Planctomycetota bacterium]